MAFGRLGAGEFGRMGLRAAASVFSHFGLLLRDGSSHPLLRAGGSNFLLLGH